MKTNRIKNAIAALEALTVGDLTSETCCYDDITNVRNMLTALHAFGFKIEERPLS